MSSWSYLAAIYGGLGLPRLLSTRGPLIVMYHGIDGVRVKDFAQQLRLIQARARTELGDRVGSAVTLFAYPYEERDDFDDDAEKVVAASGFEAACSTCYGRGSSRDERYRLRRVGIEPHDSRAPVEAKSDGHFDWIRVKEQTGAWLRRRGLGRAGA